MQRIPITKKGLEKLKKELAHLEKVERPANIQAIEEARAHGDISENAEYHAAKERQSFIDGKCDYYGAKELLESISRTGEPFQFGIEEGKINWFLSENGFDVLSHYTPGEFEKTAVNDNGESIGKMFGFACQVHARVKS